MWEGEAEDRVKPGRRPPVSGGQHAQRSQHSSDTEWPPALQWLPSSYHHNKGLTLRKGPFHQHRMALNRRIEEWEGYMPHTVLVKKLHADFSLKLGTPAQFRK